MSLVIVYDTETTGFPHGTKPDGHADQPHIVQIGAALVDESTEQVIQSIDVIVRPAGWEISEGAIAVHGITKEMAMDCGVSESLAFEMLIDLWEVAKRKVAHNEKFDAQIIRIGMKRYGLIGPRHQTPELLQEAWDTGATHCTKEMCEGVVNLGPTDAMRKAGRTHNKAVSLQEAYRYFFGEDFENAHSAMADVMACKKVYFALRNHAVNTGATVA